MKIAVFNWRDLKHKQAGGAELYLHEQAKIWVRKGHRVKWFASSVENCPAREKIDGIEFIRSGGRVGMYLTAPKIYRYEMRDCDVIIDAENGIPLFTPLFSRKKRVLLIHHIHRDVWFKGDENLLVSLAGYFLETKVMPKLYKNTRIVAVSPSSKEEILKLMPGSKIDIIYNAISKKYVPMKKAKKPELIFLGRLKRYKSIDVLLRALALVDRDLTLNIVGRGDDEPRLKKISKELGLKNVNFMGFVSDKEKIEKLQQAWFMVNPSFVEGWSITNIEANACGTPVIGSDVHGIRDSIIEGKTGFLFDYGDEKGLAKKIKFLLENDKRRKEISKEAIKWSKNFSWEKSANEFLKILGDI